MDEAALLLESEHFEEMGGLAIYLDMPELVRRLIDRKADLNKGDQTGALNALWFAGMKGNVELFRDLLKAGANYTARDEEGMSLLATIKCCNFPHKQELYDALKAHAPQDFAAMSAYVKQFKEHKRYGHAHQAVNVATIQGVNVRSMGGSPEYAAKTMAKMVNVSRKSNRNQRWELPRISLKI